MKSSETHSSEHTMPGTAHASGMKHRHVVALLACAAAAIVMTGCSERAWYDAVQFNARQSCLRQPESERARCEARLNSADHDTYRRQRGADEQPAR